MGLLIGNRETELDVREERNALEAEVKRLRALVKWHEAAMSSAHVWMNDYESREFGDWLRENPRPEST